VPLNEAADPSTRQWRNRAQAAKPRQLPNNCKQKFISTWSVPQGTFNAAVARFLETGGAPPEGVKMLGRWDGMDGKGFAISESTDPKAMYRWTAQWADLLRVDFQILSQPPRPEFGQRWHHLGLANIRLIRPGVNGQLAAVITCQAVCIPHEAHLPFSELA
jgi:hypothetical protein